MNSDIGSDSELESISLIHSGKTVTIILTVLNLNNRFEYKIVYLKSAYI